jgi:enterochelin esterase-like enzyme
MFHCGPKENELLEDVRQYNTAYLNHGQHFEVNVPNQFDRSIVHASLKMMVIVVSETPNRHTFDLSH